MLVTRLLEEAASERTAQQRIVVRLHPTDHAVLEKLLVLEQGGLTPDPRDQSRRGDGGADRAGRRPLNRIEWDASIEARVASVRAALGLRDEVEA